MKRTIYCLWDKIACEAGVLFEAQSDVHAQRMLDSIQEFPAGATKEDFEIVKLGTFFHGDENNPPKIEVY